MEEEKKKSFIAHCLLVSYPVLGHINPLLQFSRRLLHRGVKPTLATPRSITKSSSIPATDIALEIISDGYDEGGIKQAESPYVYLESLRKVGSETLIQLVHRLNDSGDTVDCIIYDGFLPWCLDVAKKFGLVGAVFFTQSCAVGSIYYHVHEGLIKIPLAEDEYLIPGLPPLEPKDLPSIIYDLGPYPASFGLVVGQFSNVGGADWVLCNTFSELEQEVVDWQAKIWSLRTIGPTIPSMYLDKQLKEDRDYGFSIFKPSSEACMKWLDDKPEGSVVYVSFGSLSDLWEEQMKELCCGLKSGSGYYFLWAVRATEEAKLPKDFTVETNGKGLIVNWCPQLEVLAHEAVGCFVTHCGWNSILEALSLGVPMVAMPQWTDQITNAKFVQDVWKMGLRAEVDEKGIVRGEILEHCIREIMEGEKGKEIKSNSQKWKNLAKTAMDKGGSSDKNIDDFVASFAPPKS